MLSLSLVLYHAEQENNKIPESLKVFSFYLFTLHTVPYLVLKQSGRYFHTVLVCQTSFVKTGFWTSETSCLGWEQYGNSDLQEPYWILLVRISVLLLPSAGGMLHWSERSACASATYWSEQTSLFFLLSKALTFLPERRLWKGYEILRGLISNKKKRIPMNNEFPGPPYPPINGLFKIYS